MIDPNLFSGVPYRNTTALVDFAGTLQLYFRPLADAIFATTGRAIRLYPIGDPLGPTWLQAIQAQYTEAADALGLPIPQDLAEYDLTRAEDHASFFFIISQETRALREAVGLS